MGEGVLRAQGGKGATQGRKGAKAQGRQGARAQGDPARLLALFADAGLAREADGALLDGGVQLEEIARSVGTPAFVYNAETIRSRFRTLDQAFAPLPRRICYAVKANGCLAVLRVLRDLGAGADIVSAGELHRVLAAGFDPGLLVFSGVGKTRAELDAACAAGVGQINLESLEELEALSAAAAASGRRVGTGIRVNPSVTVDTHPYITTGAAAAKFGIPYDAVVDVARRIAASADLQLTGLAMHLGSQLLDAAPYAAGANRLAELVAAVREAGIGTLRSLDVGGGLGIRYHEEAPLEPEDFAAAIRPLLEPLGLAIHLEPGRYLVGSAGVLLTTVLYRKHAGGKDYVVVDAGMTDLVRPSHYHAHHEIVPVRDRGRTPVTVDVVGPICESGDFLALDRPLPLPDRGDVLAVLGAGAYGFVMSSTYNARPRPPEVLVDGGRFGVARPRETLDDLLRGERAVPFD